MRERLTNIIHVATSAEALIANFILIAAGKQSDLHQSVTEMFERNTNPYDIDAPECIKLSK